MTVAFAAYRYDPWGSPLGAGTYATGVWTQGTSLVTSTLAGQIATRQVLRYAGYAYDAESGFSYCSARYYDPATRQWTSADPAKADGEQSAYRYCSGDPVGGVDATGRYAVKFRFPGSFSGDNTAFFRRVLRLNAGQAWRYRTWGKARYLWFAYKVRPSGSWDLKRARVAWLRSWDCYRLDGRLISAEDIGNIHYRYVGHAANINLNSLLLGSFITHIPTNPKPLSAKQLRNEYRDQRMVEYGYRLYWRWGKAWRPWWRPSEYVK